MPIEAFKRWLATLKPDKLAKAGSVGCKYLDRRWDGKRWRYKYATPKGRKDSDPLTEANVDPVQHAEKHMDYQEQKIVLQGYEDDCVDLQQFARNEAPYDHTDLMHAVHTRAIKLIDAMIKNHPITKETTLYRGVSFPAASNAVVGDTLQDPGYSSFSSDYEVAKIYANAPNSRPGSPVVLKVLAKKGDSALDVASHIPSYKAERQKEFLLPRLTALRVVSVRSKESADDLPILTVEVMRHE